MDISIAVRNTGDVKPGTGFAGALGATIPGETSELEVMVHDLTTTDQLTHGLLGAADAIVRIQSGHLESGYVEVADDAPTVDPHAGEQVDHGGNEDH